MQGLHLVLERGIQVVEIHRLIPGHPPIRGATTVGHEHREPLVGEPLGLQVHPLHPHDPAEMRATIGIEQHGQLLRRVLARPA